MCCFYSQRKHHSLFFSPCYAFRLGHFEFRTLLMLSGVFSEKPRKILVPDHPIGCTCKSALASLCWDQEIFALCKSSSHHPSGWVPTSSAKVSFQETSARYWTLAVRQNEYLPQVSQRVEGCGMKERVAVSPAAHPVHTCC